MRLHARPGLALPMAILLIGFITAGIIGAFGRMEGEARTLDSGRTTTLAFTLAERGLEARIAAGDTIPDSTRYTFPGGFVDVLISKVRPAVSALDSSIWVIRATGTVSGGNAARPPARRSVAQLVVRRAATLDANAAWTSLSGLSKNGSSGLISGVDECNPSASVAGASVPAGMFELQGNGNMGTFEGTPPVSEEGTQDEFAASVGIDWEGITNASAPAIEPDIIVCTGGEGYDPSWGPCESWPSFSDPTNYPTVLVNGSITLGSGDAGQGLLIVTGSLRFTGGQQTWKGVILVGQELTDNGLGYISGAVISGLDVKFGAEVEESLIVEEAVANGNKTYRYNSCEIANALAGLATLAQIPNAWIDNWSAW